MALRGAAPDDRLLSDAEWAQVAVGVMDRTGLGAAGNDAGVRWVAVRRAADSYDRAARPRYGRIPTATRDGNRLRAAARLMALAGQATGDTTLAAVVLIANLAALAVAVAELRQAQRHAAQAAAAQAAASQLHAASGRDRSPALRQHRADKRQNSRPQTPAGVAHGDFPARPRPRRPAPAAPGRPRPRPGRGPLPPRRAGPGR